jgi:signal peptidase II
MATNKKPSSKSSSGSMTPWLGIAAIVILLDQLSKITITKLFRYGEEMYVTSYFNLVLAYNKGAAFSFLSNESGWQRYMFTGIGIAAAAYILWLLRKHSGQRL